MIDKQCFQCDKIIPVSNIDLCLYKDTGCFLFCSSKCHNNYVVSEKNNEVKTKNGN